MFLARDITRLSFRPAIGTAAAFASLPRGGEGQAGGYHRRSRSRRQVGERVNGHAGQVDLEVDVRSRGVSRAALVSDDGVLVDLDAVSNGPTGQVPVERGEASCMDDDHVAPVPTEPASPAAAHREVVHDAAVGGMHRGAIVGGDVEAAMEMLAGAAGLVGLERIAGATETLGKGTVQRPLPLAGRACTGALPNQGPDLRLQGGPLRLHLGQLLLELCLDGGDLLLAGGALVAHCL